MGEIATHLAERAPSAASLRDRLFSRRLQVSFPDLVWAHHVRTQALFAEGRPDDEKERRYRSYLADFQDRYGEIVDVYWCSHEVSAVALTRKRAPLPLRLFGRRETLRLHRVSDWVTRDVPDVAALLHRCDTLAVKSSEVLRETNQRVAMQWLYALMTHLLGVVDSAKGKLAPEASEELRAEFDEEWGRLQAHYADVGVRAGQIVYFWGMTVGLGVLFALGLVLLPVLRTIGVESVDLQSFYGCYAAGALGAFVSVVQRVTQDNFRVDYEAGRKAIARVGSFRPFIGAIFGVVLYFALESGLLHVDVPGGSRSEHFAFLVVAAFLAGFSERLAKDVLENVSDRVAGGEPPAAAEQPAAPA